MPNRGNPEDMREVAEGIMDILASIEAVDPDWVAKSDLCNELEVEGDLAADLVDHLAGHGPCPLECDTNATDEVYLRRTETIEDFLTGLEEDGTNPIEL